MTKRSRNGLRGINPWGKKKQLISILMITLWRVSFLGNLHGRETTQITSLQLGIRENAKLIEVIKLQQVGETSVI